MNRKKIAALSAAIAGITLFASEPILALDTTAAQFTQTIVATLEDGDIRGARLLLRKLHGFGVEWISLGGIRVSIETLIDALRDGNPKPSVVIGKLSNSGQATFVWCDHWASKVNLAAPPPEMFPVGSSGVC